MRSWMGTLKHCPSCFSWLGFSVRFQYNNQPHNENTFISCWVLVSKNTSDFISITVSVIHIWCNYYTVNYLSIIHIFNPLLLILLPIAVTQNYLFNSELLLHFYFRCIKVLYQHMSTINIFQKSIWYTSTLHVIDLDAIPWFPNSQLLNMIHN